MRVVIHRLPRYGVAVLTTAAAALVALVLSPLSLRVPFALFAAAVLVTSLEGGLKPGLLATTVATAALAVEYWLLPSQLPENYSEVVPLLVLFVFVGLLSSYLGHRCWRAIDAAERRMKGGGWRQRAEQFCSLAACAPAGILQMDPQCRCVYLNCACQLTGGFGADEALGDGWARLVHADDRDRVVPAWIRAMQAGKEFDGEFRFQPSPQASRWVRLRSSPMYSARGKVIGHVGVLQDIAGQKDAEEALRETRTLLSAIVEESPDPLLVMSLEGNSLIANSAGARMISKPDGQSDYVSRKRELRDGQGNVVGLLSVCREISGEKRLQGELTRAKTALDKEVQTRQRVEEALGNLLNINAMLQEAVRARDRQLEALRREKEMLETHVHTSNGMPRNGKHRALEVT